MNDTQILSEMMKRIKNGEDKDNTSGKIRTLGRMSVPIKEIVRLLQLTQFQHGYVVLRKAGLLPNEIKHRTKRGNCDVCGKPFYTEESLQTGAGLICRHRQSTKPELAEVE